MDLRKALEISPSGLTNRFLVVIVKPARFLGRTVCISTKFRRSIVKHDVAGPIRLADSALQRGCPWASPGVVARRLMRWTRVG